MAKFRSHKNSLIAGEISPTAMGRTDLPMYLHACKTLRNMIPLPGGGAYRRPGSIFKQAIDASVDYAPRLLPFIYSKTVSYCLILSRTIGGNGKLTAIPTDPTTPAVTVSGTPPYQVSGVIPGGWSTYVPRYDEWFDVQYTQSGDVMWLVHPNYKPRKIYRTSLTAMRIAEFDQDSAGNYLTGETFKNAWPYRAVNSSAITLAISAATVGTGRTVTASAGFFQSTHVGAVFKSDDGVGTIGCFKITAVTNGITATAEVVVALGTTAARLTWWESAWSDYRGWPRSVGFFQNRLVLGGTPDTLWFSESFDYTQLSHPTIANPETAGNGTTGPDATQAFSYTLNSQQLNEVQWISSEKTLVVGTSGDEWIIDRLDSSAGFDCGNVSATAQSHVGSSYHMPARAGKELVFADRSDNQIVALAFDHTEEAYVPQPLQTFFDHYPKIAKFSSAANYNGDRRYRQFAWDGSRGILWCNDTAGSFFAMTRDKTLQVTAWHSHRIGGYDESTLGAAITSGMNTTADPIYESYTGSVVSLTVLPNQAMGVDDLWLAVMRKIDGDWSYHIEIISGFGGTEFDSAYNMMFGWVGCNQVDAGVIGDSADAIFDGHDHLEGEVLEGTASNSHGLFKTQGNTVLSGDVTLQGSLPPGFDDEQTFVTWGLPYESIVEPVRLEAGSQIGSAQGAVKRIHQVVVRFFKTLSAKVGADADNLETLVFREASTPMNKSAEYFTGDKKVKVDCDYDTDGTLYILQDQPLPFGIVSIIAEGVTYD